MRRTSIIVFMLFPLWLGITTALSVKSAIAKSEIDDESMLSWTNSSTKESCSLRAKLSDNATISFHTIAGHKPTLVVDVPHRNLFAKKIELYRTSPPWKNEEVFMVERVNNNSQATLVTFVKSIQPLLDKIAAGYWAELRFIGDSETKWTQSISSIGITDALKIFNDCRNTLPSIGLTEINNSLISFDIGSTQLTPQTKTLLTKIVEYLAYDDAILEIHIDSHTDSSGDHLHNLELSQKRALKVESYLLEKGIPKRTTVQVRWHGERYPLTNPEKRQSNRRVAVRLFSVRSEPEKIKPDLELNTPDIGN